MAVLDTKHKRKSAVITVMILLFLLFVVFNFGMRYLDPPEEYGLAINYGDSDVGNETPFTKTAKIAPPKVIQKGKVVKAIEELPTEKVIEKVLTDPTAKEVPVMESVKEAVKESVKEVVKSTQPKEIPKPKPSKETQDALQSLLNGNASDGEPKGEGADENEGVRGSEEGDPDVNKYYGNLGDGSGGYYNLAGRKALLKPKEQPDCEEEGIVVVSITVDKTGKVIRAVAGVKGTTNTAACLLKPAKEAALRTTWNSDSKAPSTQTGTIIYKFSLSK